MQRRLGWALVGKHGIWIPVIWRLKQGRCLKETRGHFRKRGQQHSRCRIEKLQKFTRKLENIPEWPLLSGSETRTKSGGQEVDDKMLQRIGPVSGPVVQTCGPWIRPLDSRCQPSSGDKSLVLSGPNSTFQVERLRFKQGRPLAQTHRAKKQWLWESNQAHWNPGWGPSLALRYLWLMNFYQVWGP